MCLSRATFAALLAAAALALTTAPAAQEAAPTDTQTGAAADGQLLSRIDFGNAYVMGQSIQSGAVYLLNRKASDIRSMLRERTDFRREIREDAEFVERRSP